MFVNATDMKNRFFEHPNESNIKETGEHFCLHDAVIAIDNYDGRELMDGAENAIVLSGKAKSWTTKANATFWYSRYAR